MRRTPAAPSWRWDVVTHGGDGGAGPLGGGEQSEGLRRGAGGPVRVGDAMPAPWRTQVLAEELAGAGVEQPDVDVVPLYVDAAADPAGRRAVLGRRDLDAAVQMHGAAAGLVVAKRLEGQRAERRTLFGKHGGDLALGRAVDAGIGPAPLPAVQIPLAVVEALEAEAAQRRFLGVAEGLSRSLLNFGWRTPGLLYEVIYVTPRQQPRRRAEPARPGHRPGAADRGSPGPAGSASPPPPARSPPSVESSGHHASA